ncbi:hypothetical protein [Yinghuangia seranimata]|uniref:hypothetical protein n=1 Tax=Yinghuangia seranimata TaxID=408067 RepID=UPI00248A8FAA|nr:hypothetical protein [Yinghuangia seranimata]MDI2130559.1 hypothetical protein [Yinghuangia seranimata]
MASRTATTKHTAADDPAAQAKADQDAAAAADRAARHAALGTALGTALGKKIGTALVIAVVVVGVVKVGRLRLHSLVVRTALHGSAEESKRAFRFLGMEKSSRKTVVETAGRAVDAVAAAAAKVGAGT